MALPLLFSFLGGGLAKAGVLGAAGSFLANPLVASAVGSGVGTLAETGDPQKALMGGLGSFAGGHLMGNIMGGAPATSTNAISGPMTESLRPMARPEGLGQAAASAAAPGVRGIFDAGMDFAGSAQGIGSAIGGMLPAMSQEEVGIPQAGPTFRIPPMQRETQVPGADFQPGVSGEFDYGISRPYSSQDFAERYAPQRLAMGGFVDNPYARNYAQERAQISPMADGGEVSPTRLGVEQDYGFGMPSAQPIASAGRWGLLNQSQPQSREEAVEAWMAHPWLAQRPHMFGEGPQARAYAMQADRRASGGYVGKSPTVMQRNDPFYGPVRLAAGGIAEIGAMAEPMPAEAVNEREVISGAIAAIMGQHPQPEVALGMFLQQYGEEALRDLVDRVQSGEFQDTQERFASGENGEVVGPGDGSGVDDMVPAVVDGQGDVLLSDGEFVLRKDATDALNAEFGPEFMDRMNSAGPRAPEVVEQMASA